MSEAGPIAETLAREDARRERSLSFVGMFTLVTGVAVPVVIIPLVFWALYTFANGQPERWEKAPNTISLATTDATVATVLWAVVFALSVPILVISARVAFAYRRALERYVPKEARLFTVFAVLIPFGFLLQVSAIVGLNLSILFTLADNTWLHLVGSGVFFVAQLLTILLTGFGCGYQAYVRARLPQPEEEGAPFLYHMHRVRAWFALLIGIAGVTYLTLFFVKDMPMPVEQAVMVAIYEKLEICLVSSFMLYLTCFLPDLIVRDKGRKTEPRSS